MLCCERYKNVIYNTFQGVKLSNNFTSFTTLMHQQQFGALEYARVLVTVLILYLARSSLSMSILPPSITLLLRYSVTLLLCYMTQCVTSQCIVPSTSAIQIDLLAK